MTKTQRLLMSWLCCLPITVAALQAWSVKKEATLVFVPTGSSGFVRNFNPVHPTKLETTHDFVYESLVIFDTYDSDKIYYRLATNIAYSDDLQSITIDLRRGVRWSDGEVFDADDLIFTLNLLRDHPEADVSALMLDFVESAEKLSSHQVRVRLKSPDTLAIYEFQSLFVLPEHRWRALTNVMQFQNSSPVGTGPFTEVKRFSANAYQLCRNPHYWAQDDLQVDCLSVPQLQEPAYIIAAQRGELDWFGASMSDVEKMYVAKDPAHHKYWFPPQDTISLYPNWVSNNRALKEAFTNLHFRRAMSMAIDRKAILEFANPAATAIESPAGISQTQKSWMSESVNKKYGNYLSHDVNKAKQLLASAGFKDINKDGYVETPSGKKIKIVLDVPTGWNDWISAVHIVVGGLKQAGINAELRTSEYADIIRRSRTKGEADFDMIISFSALGATPYNLFSMNFRSVYQDHCNDNTMQGWFALARYCNAKIDTALDGFKFSVDHQVRKQQLYQIQKIIAHDLPIIPLFSNPSWYQYNTKRFTGWWTSENNKGNPAAHDGNRNRLLLLLDLQPRA